MTTKAIPKTQEELAEFVYDNPEALADPKQAAEFIAAYAKEFSKHDPDLQKQLAEQKAQVEKEYAERLGVKRLPLHEDAVDGKSPRWQRNVAMSPEGFAWAQKQRQACVGMRGAPGESANGDFESLADFALAIDYNRLLTGKREASDRITKVLGEGQGDQGGFLVPEEFRAEIMMLSLEESIVRPRATIVPMTRLEYTIPTIRDTSHASTVFGGVQAYWTPENTASTASEPTFSQARLTAEKLAGHTQAGMEVQEDSVVSLEALITQMYSRAVAYFEDDAFIAGTGAGQPTGILNADALVTVAKETGQAADTIVWENIVKMFARMLPQSIGRAVWIANNDTIPQLATMSLAVGTGGSAVWLQNGQGALPTSILGRPILYTEKAETVGDAGDLYLADLSQYLIGDRRQLMISNSPHFAFTSDQMTWKFTHRVGGRPWLDSALTPRNGSNTLSPFVNLAARA